jgi:hypothetical protein
MSQGVPTHTLAMNIFRGPMVKEPGPELDRLIQRKLNGEAKKNTPPYSTSEKIANRLLRRLEMEEMPSTLEEIEGVWYCTFWVLFAGRRERLSTGSGETRALAIARAVMNARLGMSRSLSETKPEAMNNRIFLTQDLAVSTADRAPRTCDGCGAPLANRNRETASRFCTVCSWRAGKEKIAAATRLEP